MPVDPEDLKNRVMKLEQDQEELVDAVEQLVEWNMELTDALRVASSLYASLRNTTEELKDEQRQIRWVGKTDKPPI